jgi:hypothetical protein
MMMRMRMTLFGMKDELKKTNMFKRLLIDSTALSSSTSFGISNF